MGQALNAARDLLEQGGWVLALLAWASVATWALIAWKWTQLASLRGTADEWTDRAAACLRRGDAEHALGLARARTDLAARCFVAVCATADPPIRRGSSGYDPGPAAATGRAAADPGRVPRATAWAAALSRSLVAEAERLREHLPLIAALGGCAPLLGLLGTVMGMMDTFEVLGARDAAGSTVDGIRRALVTTQAGLVVALPILLAHRLLAARVERSIDRAALGLTRLRAAIVEE